MQGFVQLHRKVADCWIAEDPMALALWVRILIEATHKPRKVFYKGCTYNLKEGELLFGLSRWAEKTGISREVIRKRIEMLEGDNMITRSKHPKISIISIVNWSSYQNVNTVTTRSQHAHNTVTTRSEHQYNNVNNVNNVNNEKESHLEQSQAIADHSETIEKWNDFAEQAGLQTLRGITPRRAKAIKSAYSLYKKTRKALRPDDKSEPMSESKFLDAMVTVAIETHDDFHLGKNDRKWKMNFDYLLQQKIVDRVTETGSIA